MRGQTEKLEELFEFLFRSADQVFVLEDVHIP